jgi:signal transduction histidine kinase
MLALSFLVFSAYQFFYLLLLVFDLSGEQALQPGARGLINLMMIAIMSMSMSIWLLEDEREKLQQSNKDLDSFIYSTSHDLRAPITSILGLTYLGKVELGEEKARHYMELIEQRVKKLNMILSDILRLSKTKKFNVQMTSVDFNEAIKEALSDIEFNQGSAGIRFIYEPRQENVCFTDENQLSIILSNLISNAVNYHRLNQDDPYIKVTFERTNQQVTIQIEDNGQGIPPQSLHKVFDMFYRANQQTEGTGLGLYIVKEALSKIKGKIEVASVFGKGTTFTVRLENA